LLLKEFDCKIRDKKGSKNLIADHLYRILCGRECESNIFICYTDE